MGRIARTMHDRDRIAPIASRLGRAWDRPRDGSGERLWAREVWDVARVDLALAAWIAGYPWVADGFDTRERRAIGRAGVFLGELDPPWFVDGLSLEEHALLVVLRGDADLIADLMDSYFVQSSTITLPLAGEVNAYVFYHDPFPPGDEMVRRFEEVIFGVEELMGAPFPVSDVIVRV